MKDCMNVRGMFGNAVGANQNKESSLALHLWPLGGDNSQFGDFVKVPSAMLSKNKISSRSFLIPNC